MSGLLGTFLRVDSEKVSARRPLSLGASFPRRVVWVSLTPRPLHMAACLPLALRWEVPARQDSELSWFALMQTEHPKALSVFVGFCAFRPWLSSFLIYFPGSFYSSLAGICPSGPCSRTAPGSCAGFCPCTLLIAVKLSLVFLLLSFVCFSLSFIGSWLILKLHRFKIFNPIFYYTP